MSVRWLLLALLLCLSPAVLAQPAGDPSPLPYRDATEEARFHALAAELRCVQCQNQSLADSDAMIARDMRRQVLALMREGRDDGQIKAWLVERYGEFVLYRPRWHGAGLALWLLPGLVLLAGAAMLWRTVRRRPPPGDGGAAGDDAGDGPAW